MKIKKSIKKSEITNYRRNFGSMLYLNSLKNPAYADFEKKTARARRAVNSIQDPAMKLAAKLKWINPLGEDMKTPTWNDVARENGYQIYYATSKTGTYKLLDTVRANDVSETCAGLTSGKTYYFKVRAYKTVNSTKVYSSFSPVKGLKIK